MPIRRRVLLGCAVLPTVTQAQPWEPARPIRLVVPYPPGGSTDLLARVIAERLTGAIPGATVLVENRPGGAAVIGTVAVAQATPDGYTLALGTNQTHAANPALLRDLPYRLEDFAGIGRIATVHHAFVVPMVSTSRSLAELAAQPALTYASSGVGSASHLIAESFCLRHRIAATHVPYRGGAQATADTLAGVVEFFVSTWPQVAQLVQEGRLRCLGIGAPARLAEAPEVPVLAELGAGDLAIDAWFGLWAPAATPATIIRRLADLLAELLEDPDTQARIGAMGFNPAPLPPTPFAAFQAAEVARWKALVALTGVRGEG
jgi:tripartite-type tricarboxylate transporter receptor subunit TctC